MTYDNWRTRAECWGADPSLFDGRGIKGEDPEPSEGFALRTRAALTYCRACPVARQCLDYANTHHVIGVWGNRVFTENQRRREAIVAFRAAR
jgi:WhiB family redox-sensing transcriptional regulator